MSTKAKGQLILPLYNEWEQGKFSPPLTSHNFLHTLVSMRVWSFHYLDQQVEGLCLHRAIRLCPNWFSGQDSLLQWMHNKTASSHSESETEHLSILYILSPMPVYTSATIITTICIHETMRSCSCVKNTSMPTKLSTWTWQESGEEWRKWIYNQYHH